MIKKLSVCVGILLIGAFAGYQYGYQNTSETFTLNRGSIEAHSKDFTTQWQAAFDAEDFVALRDLYEPDAWLMAQGQPARKGVDDIMAYLRALRESGMTTDVQTMTEDQFTDGNYTFSTTKWRYEYIQKDGNIASDSGRSFVILKHGEDGKLRLWRAVKNQSPDVSIEDFQK